MVREERIELHPCNAALGEQGAVLLDNAEEVRYGVSLRKDDSLAEECAAFRTADVEDVCEACDVGECHVVCRAGERVGEARTVEVERYAACTADGADGFKLCEGVERTVLRWLREVDHAGHDHVLTVRILAVSGECAFDLRCRDLPCLVRERQHLVSAELDRARLVHADMSCFGGDDALIGTEQRVDDDGICLRAADEEEDFSVVRLAGGANLLAGGFGIGVKPVARRLLHVRLPKAA